MTTEKLCRHCQRLLPTAAFTKDRHKKDGLRSTCTECRRAGMDKRPEKRDGMQRCSKCKEYKPATTEHFSIYPGGQAYRYCRPCARTNKRAWWASLTPEERQQKDTRTPEQKAVVKKRHWRKLRADPERLDHHRQKGRQAWARAYAADPTPFIIRGQQDRAKRFSAEGTFTKQDLAECFRRQKGCCIYCGCDVRRKWTVEHLIPLSRGGANSPENIAIACPTCNFSKRDKLPHEFMPERFPPPEHIAQD